MGEMKEIVKLLENEETIKLGIHLICKNYNFRVLPKYSSIKESKLLRELHMSYTFISKYNIETEQGLIYDSIFKFKRNINTQHLLRFVVLGQPFNNVYKYTKSGHEKIKITWYIKQ